MFDTNQFLELFVRQSHLLTIDDTVGAASSVRVRSPSFDRQVMEFAASLPTRHKIGLTRVGSRNKLVLRELARRYMPADLVYAEKFNCGHFIDYEARIRSPWRPEVEAMWHRGERMMPDVLSAGGLADLWRRFLANRLTVQDRYTFRKTLVFLVWHEEVFEGITGR